LNASAVFPRKLFSGVLFSHDIKVALKHTGMPVTISRCSCGYYGKELFRHMSGCVWMSSGSSWRLKARVVQWHFCYFYTQSCSISISSRGQFPYSRRSVHLSHHWP